MGRSSPTGLPRSRNANGPSTATSTTPIRRTPRCTVSAAGRIRGWPGAGSATTPSDSTACRSCSSRRFWISIPITRTRRCGPSPGSGNARQSCRRDREPPRPDGPSITSASGRTRPTTSTAWHAPHPNASHRCRSDSRSRTLARSSRCRRPRRRPMTGGCWHGGSFRTRVCWLPRPAPRPRRRTGSATGRGSAIRERWIACSFRARPATSAA